MSLSGPSAAVCLLAVFGTLDLAGCAYRTLEPQLHDAGNLPAQSRKASSLKIHLLSGELYVLDSWRASSDGSRIEGEGTRYSVTRQPGAAGHQSIAVDQIALLETDTPRTVMSGGLSGLGIVGTVLGGVTAVCVADPKSCFGSCPTFYLEGGDPSRPAAEGFSDSIARALEASDLDALFGARVDGRQLVVTMRNEALETHAVRRVRLRVAPRPPGGRVLADPVGTFYPAYDLTRPDSCQAAEGDCLGAVAEFDAVERLSPADPEDLASRETIDLTFDSAAGRRGIVVGARQTLLTTYLFYQTMAYLGRHAGETLAALERAGPAGAGRAMGMARALGGIDVAVSEADGAFRPVGTFDEAGPIAGDVQVFPFEASGGSPLRVRLRLAKGHWRLGWVALARLGDPVAAQPLEPAWVEHLGKRDARALARLRGRDRHLVTVPGDTYRLGFALPRPGSELELFLESEGYYYEWMRDEWLADEDQDMAWLALTSPEEALRRLAGPYKLREAVLDRGFEASRFRR